MIDAFCLKKTHNMLWRNINIRSVDAFAKHTSYILRLFEVSHGIALVITHTVRRVKKHREGQFGRCCCCCYLAVLGMSTIYAIKKVPAPQKKIMEAVPKTGGSKRQPRQPGHPPRLSKPQEPMAPPPPPPPPAPVPQIADTVEEFDQLPEWATMDPDPTVWWKVMEDFGVDDIARQSVFCLAQLSDAGREAANGTI